MRGPIRSVWMDPVIDMNGSQAPPFDPLRRQCREQRRRINSAAECNNQPNIGETRQQLRQVGNEPLRAEWVRGQPPYSSENSPNDAIRAERAARNSSRGMASSWSR